MLYEVITLKAEIRALPGEWMYDVRGIADQRDTRRDQAARCDSTQREGARRADQGKRADGTARGRLHRAAQGLGIERQQALRLALRERPDHRYLRARQRQQGENRPSLKPLARHIAVRSLAGKIGHDGTLTVGSYNFV